MNRLIFRAFLCICLLCSCTLPGHTAKIRPEEELRLLRDQTAALLQADPEKAAYIRQLLTLTAGIVALEALAAAAQTRTLEAAVLKARQDSRVSAASQTPAREGLYLFAKRRAPELTGNLFDQPEPSAPTPKPRPEKDLSWLDEPFEPVAPRQPEPTLFDEPAKEINPKTRLSRKIIKEYEPRISQLPLSQQQGLIEALDEAVLRKKTSGLQNALKFLEQKAWQSRSPLSLYFIVAKRYLVLAGILVGADLLTQDFSAEKMTARLMQNPALFLDATDAQLHRLARDAQAVAVCRKIAQAVELLAHTPLTPQEQAFLSEQRPMRTISTAPSAR